MPAIDGITAASSPPSPAPSPPIIAIDEPALRKLASWLAGARRRRRSDDQRPHGRGVLAHARRARDGHAHRRRRAARAACRSSRRSSARASPMPPSTRARPRDAGAVALDVMPPHHWLRFGFTPRSRARVLRRDPPGRAGPRPRLPRLPGMDARVVLVATAGRSRAPALRPGVQGRPARHEQVCARHPGDPRRRCRQVDPHLPRRVPARVDGAGRRRRARRLRDVHSAAHRRPVDAP